MKTSPLKWFSIQGLLAVALLSVLFTPLSAQAAETMSAPTIEKIYPGCSSLLYPDDAVQFTMRLTDPTFSNEYSLAYEVLYGTTSSPNQRIEPLKASISNSSDSYFIAFEFDTTLSPGTTYYFKVRRCHGTEKSPWSNTMTFTPPGLATPTITDASFYYESYSTHAVHRFSVSWNPVAGAEYYSVNLRNQNNSNTVYYESNITSTSLKFTPYNSTSLTPGQPCYVAVMAHSATSMSEASLYPITIPNDVISHIYLDHTTLTLASGETQYLTETISPLRVVNSEVNWASSNPDVASVSAYGNVTALSPGRTSITCSATYGDAFAVCEVVVTGETVDAPSQPTPPEEIRTGSGALNESINWTVDEAGNLTLSGSGPIPALSYSTIPWRDLRPYITSVFIGDGITAIGEYALQSLDNVTSVSLPNTLERIDAWAFSSCSALERITIPSRVSTIDTTAFHNCTGLTTFTVAEGNPHYAALSGALFDADLTTLLIYPSGRSATSYTAPYGTTHIEAYAFYNSRLQTITLPATVASIGQYAFYDCTDLVQCDLPESVTEIGRYAFMDSGITSMVLPSSLRALPDGLFDSCEYLDYVVIPNSLLTIGKGVFFRCNNLSHVNYAGTQAEWNSIIKGTSNEPLIEAQINFNSTHIHIGGTSTCTTRAVCTLCGMEYGGFDHHLTSFDYKSATCTTTGWNSYVTCSKCSYSTFEERPLLAHTLKLHGAFPATCEDQGHLTHYKCSSCNQCFSDAQAQNPIDNLADITLLPLGHDFNMSTGLCARCKIVKPGYCGADLTWTLDENGVLTISGTGAMWPNIGWKRTDVKSVVMNYGITAISSSAFESHSLLTSISIPNSVTSIGEYAFARTAITDLEIPNSVTTIGKSAFSGTAITDLVIPNSVEALAERALYGCNNLESLTIPFVGTSRTSSDCLGILFDYSRSSYTDSSSGAIIFKTSYHYPSSLTSVTFTDCITIPRNAFKDFTQLQVLTLPSTLTAINTDLSSCKNLTDIYFPGTNADWAALYSGELNATVHFTDIVATNFALNKTSLVIYAGTTETLTPIFTPENTSDQTVNWHSSNPDIVAVENGALTAKRDGTVTITATAIASGRSARCTITVLPEYRINSITVRDSHGAAQDTIPTGSCLVTVSVTHLTDKNNALILLAAYSDAGQFQGVLWVEAEDLPSGSTIKLTLPLDNSAGTISNLKAFPVLSFTNLTPVGDVAQFNP